MSNQLVMYEEELAQISNICDVLQRDSNAKAVLVIDKKGTVRYVFPGNAPGLEKMLQDKVRVLTKEK